MNEEINDITKIVKSIEESGLLIKGVSETGTLGASLLGNLLTGKGTIRAREGIVKTGQDF